MAASPSRSDARLGSRGSGCGGTAASDGIVHRDPSEALASPRTRVQGFGNSGPGRVRLVAYRENTLSSFRESEQTLHDAARAAVGYDDFGDDRYLEALRVLLGSLDDDGNFTAMGEVAVKGIIVDALKSRLHLERGLAQHPACADAPIERPLVIIGLARTGTSALHHLLAQDPDLQGLQLWLAHTPKPRPPRSQWVEDPDFRVADESTRAIYERSPEMKAIHHMAADQVDECWYLLAQNFIHSSWDANCNVPSYSKWWLEQDMTPSYRHHKRNLQLIGHREPEKRWLLKDSTHLFDLEAFLSVYPGAMVIHTHRDPVSVIPSTASLCWASRASLNADADPVAFGRSTLALWARAIDNTLEARGGRGEEQFYDLQFRDLQRDPLAAIRKIYDYFGLPVTDAAADAMQRFRADNPPGKHGEHSYQLKDWGLSEGEIRDRFARYVERFDIPTDSE